MANTPTYKRLYRSRDDRMLAGVCAGIARHLNIDPVAARALFAVVTIFTWGTGLLGYILLWVLVPEEPVAADPWPPATAEPPRD